LSTVDNGTLSTMDSQSGLNSTAAALLGLLRRHGPMTGGDLVRTAETVIGNYWPLTRSQIYRELTALTGDQLLSAGPPGPRRTRRYSLTPAGEAAFLAWLQASPGDAQPRMPLLLTVLFGADLPPGRLAEILEDYERRHRERLAHYRALHAELADSGVDPYARATLGFGIRHEQAVLQWLADLPAQLGYRDP
jgi:DNA-binding PadR family transcriptional regulator